MDFVHIFGNPELLKDSSGRLKCPTGCDANTLNAQLIRWLLGKWFLVLGSLIGSILAAEPNSSTNQKPQEKNAWIIENRFTLSSITATGAINANALLRSRAYRLSGAWGGQCVQFVRMFLNIYNDSQFAGNAKDLQPNSKIPEIGAVVLINNKLGHAAVVIGIHGNELELAESNWNGDEIIHVGRKIKITDSQIQGYYISRNLYLSNFSILNTVGVD